MSRLGKTVYLYNDVDVKSYETITSAINFIVEKNESKYSKYNSQSLINKVRKLCSENAKFLGYTWSFDPPSARYEITVIDDSDDNTSRCLDKVSQLSDMMSEIDVFTFRDNVDSLFLGKNVRVYEQNSIKFVSLIDIITLLTSDPNYASKIYNRVIHEYEELKDFIIYHTFEGQGQKSTPLVDKYGLMEFLMVLPGKKAALFRRKAAKILVRYLEGDVTLVQEIVDNASTTIPENHVLETPKDFANKLFRLSELSCERQKGRNINEFGFYPCVYILNVKYNGLPAVKVGSTMDFIRRIGEHINDLDVTDVYSIIPCSAYSYLEREVHMRLRTYKVNGESEIYHGVSAQQIDDLVFACLDNIKKDFVDNQVRDHEFRMKELEIKKLELECRLKGV